MISIVKKKQYFKQTGRRLINFLQQTLPDILRVCIYFQPMLTSIVTNITEETSYCCYDEGTVLCKY